MVGNSVDEKKTLIWVSVLISSTTALKQLLGLCRTKLLAIYLGPVGVGVWGYIQSFVDACQAFSLFGVDRSGIAELVKLDAERERNATFLSMLLIVFLALLVLSGVLVIFESSLSVYIGGELFGGGEAVVYKIIAVLFFYIGTTLISIYLNGTRAYKSMAYLQGLGAILSTFAVGVALYGLYGVVEVIDLYLLWSVVTFSVALSSYFYSAGLGVSVIGAWRRAKDIIQKGRSYWLAQLLTLGTIFLINYIVLDGAGSAGFGFYIAAWALSAMFVTLLLGPLAAGYFPLISRMASDGKDISNVVSWQVGYGFLIAGLVVSVVWVFSADVMSLLYSDEFVEASSSFRLFLIATMLRFIGFPLGYAVLAHSKGRYYFYSQLILNVMYLLLVYSFLGVLSWKYIAICYIFSYLTYVSMLLYFLQKCSGYKLGWGMVRVGLVQILSFLIVVALEELVSGWGLPVLKLIILIALILYFLRVLHIQHEVSVFGLVWSKVRKIVF